MAPAFRDCATHGFESYDDGGGGRDAIVLEDNGQLR